MPPFAPSMGLAPGKRLRIYDAYIEKRQQLHNGELDAEEAMSTSDFPTYLGKLMRHTFLARFQEVAGAWQQYTRDFSLEDFESYTSSRFGRFPNITEKSLNGPYEELTLKEFDGETMKLREWGNAFSLTRQLVISDRLNKLSDLPTLFADALARTMNKVAAVDAFEANPTMYDGNALFSAGHANLGAATALTATAAGAALLQALELKLDTQTDDEGYKITTPSGGETGDGNYALIIPVELKYVAKAINQNTLIINAANYLEPNPVAGHYSIIIERFFTDANNYYMASDLKGPLGFLAHITLNGNTIPFLGLQDPDVRAVLGGDDPYSFEFDEIRYKIRHDFNFKPVEWRGIAAALPA